MKKIFVITLAIAAMFSFAGASFAEDSKSVELIDRFIKAVEKGTVDVSYTMESKSRRGDTETVSVSKSYFVNAKKFVTETEFDGNSVKVAIDPAGSWLHDRGKNVLMPLEGQAAAKFDLQGALVKLGQACDISESREGDDTVFTLVHKERKLKTVFTAGKDGYLVKMVMKNEKGDTLSESVYKDYKFGKIDESHFKKPEGVKLYNADGTPKEEAPAPATEKK